MQARHIIQVVGADAIASRLDVTHHSIRAAKTAGTFPASWYAAIFDLCAERGLECPVEAFNFKSPSAPAPSSEGV